MSIRNPRESQFDRIGRADGVPASGPLAPVPSEARPTGLTYEPFYGLKEKPFSLTSDARFFYHSRSHAPAFDDLLAAIRRRESLNVLTGDIGTGKTTLCRAVLENLDRKTFSAFVPDPFASREDLLKVVLMDFGVISAEDLTSGRLKDASRTELSYVLYEFLATLEPLQAFAVVIIDEAQNLSLPLLEEIRILSDADGQLQVVLVGQLELRDKLTLPEMRQVEQRVSVHATLSPLERDGVAGYVAHRLQTAGGSPDRVRFSPEATETLYRMSGGVPRLINRLCDRALHYGYLRRAATIDAEILEASIPSLARSAPPPAVAASEPAALMPATPAPAVPAAPVAAMPSAPIPAVPVAAMSAAPIPVVPVAPMPAELIPVVPVAAMPPAPVPAAPMPAVPVAATPAAPTPAVPEAAMPAAPMPVASAALVVKAAPIALAIPLGAVAASGQASIVRVADAAARTAQGPDPVDAWIAAVDEQTATLEFPSESEMASAVAADVQAPERVQRHRPSRRVTHARGQRSGLRFVLPPQVKPSAIDRATRRWRRRLGVAALALTSVAAALIGAPTLIEITVDMWAATTQVFAPPDVPELPPAKRLAVAPELKVPPMPEAVLQEAFPAGHDPVLHTRR